MQQFANRWHSVFRLKRRKLIRMSECAMHRHAPHHRPSANDNLDWLISPLDIAVDLHIISGLLNQHNPSGQAKRPIFFCSPSTRARAPNTQIHLFYQIGAHTLQFEPNYREIIYVEIVLNYRSVTESGLPSAPPPTKSSEREEKLFILFLPKIVIYEDPTPKKKWLSVLKRTNIGKKNK